MPTLYSHIFYSFLHYLDLKMLVTVKLDGIWQKGLPFNIEDFTGLLNFEWHSQNEVGSIGILYCGEIMKNFGLFSEQKYTF